MQQWDARQTPPWVWVSLGIGSGLVIAVLLSRTLRRPRPCDDPRARQVQELVAEAERLLHRQHGRRLRPSRPSGE